MSVLFHAPYPVVLKCIQEEDVEEFPDRAIEDKSSSERSSPIDERGHVLLEMCSDIIREMQQDVLNVPFDNEHQFSYNKSSVRGRIHVSV